MTQHAGLDTDRWATFDVDQQILMIANEMNRVARSVGRGDRDAAKRGYERVLRLTDLTVQAAPRPALLRELLRWRDVVAELYLSDLAQPTSHRDAFRALLQLRPEAAKQIPYLVPRTAGER